MANNLYLMSGDNAVSAQEYHYEYESELQKLIADNPHLIDIDQSTGEHPLMLIQREFGTSEDTGLSLDHLFVDRSGVPVIVEVKRAVDTRIRREVVAQVLDYASTASSWDIETLRSLFRETNATNEELLREIDTDEFWDAVGTNLRAENLRLVFAADRIPLRLRNIIEFLDRNMDTISVYGVEIRQFQTADSKLVTSNVLQSSSKQQKASDQPQSIVWGLQSMIERITSDHGIAVANVAKSIIDYVRDTHGLIVRFSKGKVPICRVNISESNGFMNIRSDLSAAVVAFQTSNTAKRLGGEWTQEQVIEVIKQSVPNPNANVNLSNKKWAEVNVAALNSGEKLSAFQSMLSTFVGIMKDNGLVDTTSVSATASSIKWDADSITDRVDSVLGENAALCFSEMFSQTVEHGFRCSFGAGKKFAQLVAHFKGTDWFYTFCCGYRDAWLEIPVDGRKKALLDPSWTEARLREHFSSFPNMNSELRGYIKQTPVNVKIDFRLLTEGDNLATFIQMLISLKDAMQTKGTDSAFISFDS